MVVTKPVRNYYYPQGITDTPSLSVAHATHPIRHPHADFPGNQPKPSETRRYMKLPNGQAAEFCMHRGKDEFQANAGRISSAEYQQLTPSLPQDVIKKLKLYDTEVSIGEFFSHPAGSYFSIQPH